MPLENSHPQALTTEETALRSLVQRGGPDVVSQMLCEYWRYRKSLPRAPAEMNPDEMGPFPDAEAVRSEALARIRAMALAAPQDSLKPFVPKLVERFQPEYDNQTAHELCFDLSWEFAQASVALTGGDDIGSASGRYKLIVQKLRPLGDSLRPHFETNEGLEMFLSELDACIRRYVVACIHGTPPNPALNPELLSMLAMEHSRDRKILLRFLSAVFTRWREIDEPGSVWRGRVQALQLRSRGYNTAQIRRRLVKQGDAPDYHFDSQITAYCVNLRKYLSRNTKASVGKNFGFGLHRAKKR